jgi:ATP-binding cassette subfamily G (WHITE) protein 2 (PDR)
MLSNILIEIPWNTLMAALIFVCWYYPTGWHQTVHPEHERGFLAFLFVWMFMLFTSTFSHLVVSGIPTAETAGNIANICYMLCTAFSG